VNASGSAVFRANQKPAGTAMLAASSAVMTVPPRQNPVRSSAGSSSPARIPRYRNPRAETQVSCVRFVPSHGGESGFFSSGNDRIRRSRTRTTAGTIPKKLFGYPCIV
jgi:hypothetical protein